MNTTYYLGAGASAQALPCVADLSGEIGKVFDFILGNLDRNLRFATASKNRSFENVLVQSNDYDYGALSERLVNLRDLAIAAIGSQLSIDTWAKILYLTDRDYNYIQLKGIIMASFIYWEKNKGFDKRYENFWATIMSAAPQKQKFESSFKSFASQINVVSWNYDTQMEHSLNSIYSQVTTHTTINDVNQLRNKTVEELTSIPYIKLNGSARLQSGRSYWVDGLPVDWYDLKANALAMLLIHLIVTPEHFDDDLTNIRFCWEDTATEFKQRLGKFKEVLKDTSTLVVIGYSFPSINHSMDTQIISSMSKLKKVYFQGRDKRDSERIMDYFEAIRSSDEPLKLIPIEAAGFFIPPEVTLGSI